MPHQLNPLKYYWCHNEISFPWCHCLRENIIFCQFTIFVDFMDIVKTHIFFFIICSFEWFVISRCHGYLRVCSFCPTHGSFVTILMLTCIVTTDTVKKDVLSKSTEKPLIMACLQGKKSNPRIIVDYCADLLHVLSNLPRDLNFIEHTRVSGWKV